MTRLAMKQEVEIQLINPSDYVSDARQIELAECAATGFPNAAIRLAIQEAIYAERNPEVRPLPPTLPE